MCNLVMKLCANNTFISRTKHPNFNISKRFMIIELCFNDIYCKIKYLFHEFAEPNPDKLKESEIFQPLPYPYLL